MTGSLCDHGDEQAAQNTDPPKRSWFFVDWLPSFDHAIYLPWPTPHAPYIALYIEPGGHEGGPKGWRKYVHIQFMWGRAFTWPARGGFKVWEPRGRYRDA